MKNIHDMSASEIADNIKRRRLTSEEVARALIKIIRKLEKKIRAWAYFKEGVFLEQARLIDKKISSNGYAGTLAGVPVGVKDIFNTFDMPTSMGSELWKGFTPGNDARVVFRLRDEGGVISGKTATAEFAVHQHGPTRNPHNTEYYPGTSSSGSAAAAACGMVPVAIGTQTAGSIIRPASYCGVYGFKPTFGLVPRTGILKTTDTFDQVGWFARSPEDIKLLFEIMRVKGKNYPYAHKFIDKKPPEYFIRKKWKIYAITHPKWMHAEAYAQNDFVNFTERLSKIKNMTVKHMKLPAEFDRAYDAHDDIYAKELSYYFKNESRKKRVISRIFYDMVKKGARTSLRKYWDALDYQAMLRNKLDRIFKGCDIMITLSTSGSAPKLSNPVDKPDSCLIWTLCGAPVMNMPIFKGPEELPFGAQVVARRYNDLLLFNFVEMLKRAGLVKNIRAIEPPGRK